MPKKPAPRDPRAAYRRKVVSERRFPPDAACKCGERRPSALIPSSDPITCARCDRRAKGKNESDYHHPAGRANNPTTIKTPVNDHRAHFSTAQHDWPKKTLENPDGSPLRSGAAHIRGFVDLVIYLMEAFLLWVADMLELLDTFLIEKFGHKWWKRTNLDSFEPES